MKIQIPWELFLKRAETNRKNIEACILEACRKDGQNEYVIQLQEKLRLYQQVKDRQKDLQDGMERRFYLEELNEEIKDLRERILPDLKDKGKLTKDQPFNLIEKSRFFIPKKYSYISNTKTNWTYLNPITEHEIQQEQ